MQIDYINCTGLEGSLWRWCHHFTHTSGCSHDDDVGVQCHPGNFGYNTEVMKVYTLDDYCFY